MKRFLGGTVLTVALVAALLEPAAAQADPAVFTVSGHVTTGSSVAIPTVSLLDAAGNDVADTDDGDVSDSGDYSIAGVPPGHYTAVFSDGRADQDNAYLPRYYGDVVTDDLGGNSDSPNIKYFDVTTADVTGINGTLDLVPFAEAGSKPAISGSRQFGKTLSVDTDSWLEAADFTYQWFRGNSPIAGANDDAYVIDALDLGQSIFVTVGATEDGYADYSQSSAAVLIPAGAKVTGTAPTVTGVAKVGKTLRAKPGTWSPSGVKFRYQWTVNGKAIKKATKAKLKLTRAFAGKKIRVVVTGGKIGVGGAVTTSKAIKVKR